MAKMTIFLAMALYAVQVKLMAFVELPKFSVKSKIFQLSCFNTTLWTEFSSPKLYTLNQLIQKEGKEEKISLIHVQCSWLLFHDYYRLSLISPCNNATCKLNFHIKISHWSFFFDTVAAITRYFALDDVPATPISISTSSIEVVDTVGGLFGFRLSNRVSTSSKMSSFFARRPSKARSIFPSSILFRFKFSR